MIYDRGMKKVNSIYNELFKNRVSPIFFDEIGKLEIQGNGFYKMLKKALKKNLDVVFTIREDLIEKLVDKMNISNYEIIGR
jgi:nucleoside-triphosphatase THEP1